MCITPRGGNMVGVIPTFFFFCSNLIRNTMKIKIGKLHIEINASVSWDKPYMKKVIQAIRKDKFLEAVKIYKNATGKNLKESKEDVRLIWKMYS